MRSSITVTSKGQVTLPAYVRRQMGVLDGGVLQVDFDNIHNRLVVTKPVSFEEIQSEAGTYIKPGILPLMNVGQFYETHQPKP